MNADLSEIYNAQLTDDEFNRLSQFIYTNYGIKMPPVKKIMLQSRLQKRLRVLQISNFKKYIEYVFSPDGQEEVIQMIDVVSTNKTDFFREPVHFEFLMNEALPAIVKPEQVRQQVKIWSAGCSSGEEPYTIAMVTNEYRQSHPNFDFSILATDISTEVLQRGAQGIYKEERLEGIPINLIKSYFLRSKDRTKKLVRIVPELRQRLTFKRLNFMDTHYSVQDLFDVIFCRNALIYFDHETQERVINKLCLHLKPDGFFFLGHSESITNMKVPLKHIKPTIFKKI